MVDDLLPWCGPLDAIAHWAPAEHAMHSNVAATCTKEVGNKNRSHGRCVQLDDNQMLPYSYRYDAAPFVGSASGGRSGCAGSSPISAILSSSILVIFLTTSAYLGSW